MKNYKKKYQNYQEEISMMLNEQEVSFESKCLYCYEEINSSMASFHQTCNKKFFGQLETPFLDYKKEDLSELASKITFSQTTVTGVQAKVSLSIKRKEEENNIKKLTIVGLYGDYILKPQSDYYPQLPEVEDMTMHLAAICGIKTVPHSLVYLNDGTLSYITKRIDRTKKGKLHMEDMCQLTERLTQDKYKGSHEQIAKAIIKYSSNPLLDVTNFFEQVIFSYLTGNADMHLKNFSLIEQEPDKYVLAPAYDLVSTALVNPDDNEELALSLNGKKRKLNYQDFQKAFETSGLSKKILDNMLHDFYWCRQEMVTFSKKSFLSTKFKLQFEELLNQRYSSLF